MPLKMFNLTNPSITVHAIILLLIIIVSSCTEKEKQSEAKGFQTKYLLALHVNAGVKYYYTIDNYTETELKVNGKKVTTKNTTTTGLVYEILNDSTKGYLLKMTYDSLRMIAKNGAEETSLDAANGAYSLNPPERLLAGLKGSSLLVHINIKGEVISVDGYKAIADKLLANVKNTSEMEKRQLQTQLYDMLGEDFVKNNLEESLNLFPDAALYIGDSWIKKTSQTSPFIIDLTNNYSLEDVNDGKIRIKSLCNIAANNSAINFMNANAKADLKGEGDGKYLFDEQTGMLLNEEFDFDIEGMVQLMGQDVPISMKITRNISSRKL